MSGVLYKLDCFFTAKIRNRSHKGYPTGMSETRKTSNAEESNAENNAQSMVNVSNPGTQLESREFNI